MTKDVMTVLNRKSWISNMSNQVWQFTITDNMIEHLDMNELSLFINSLEDSIQDICSNYDVEPWEMSDVD
jgi:hypothetical protein